MIPNNIHFIYGLRKDFGGKNFSFIHFLAILSAWKINQPDALFYHYEYEPSGYWWERARPYLQLNKVKAPNSIFDRPIKHFAHQADVLRLEILQDQGGIYLDNDIFCINSFKPLLKYGFVMGKEPGVGLCNAVILSQASAPFLARWFEGYRKFNDLSWNQFSVILPHRLAKKNPNLIHVEDGFSFFYPMYNRYLQTFFFWKSLGFPNITRSLRFLANYKERQFAILSQAYATHLWEQFWWELYLKDLTPLKVLNSNSNFSRIVKKVLSEETLSEL